MVTTSPQGSGNQTMKTLLTFTMIPTEPMVTILAGTLIIAGVALIVTYILLHQARTEREQAIRNAMMWTDEARGLKNELEEMTAKRNAINQELDWERFKLKEFRESRNKWQQLAEKSQADIDQWKALYIEQLNRANRFEELHQRMTKRPRDPKTGRIISKSKAVSDTEALNLCDEIKARAVEDIAPKPQVYRSKVLNIGFDAAKGYDVIKTDEAFEPCDMPDDEKAVEWLRHGNSVTLGKYHYTTKLPERKPHTLQTCRAFLCRNFAAWSRHT
jgi:hypothetical protein